MVKGKLLLVGTATLLPKTMIPRVKLVIIEHTLIKNPLRVRHSGNTQRNQAQGLPQEVYNFFVL